MTDPQEVRAAVEEIEAERVAPSRSRAVAVLITASLGAVAVAASSLGWFLAYEGQRDQVKAFQAQSGCRSEIAAATDVKQGESLIASGDTLVATARGLVALALEDGTGMTGLVVQLDQSADALERANEAYKTQLEARAATAVTCK